MPERIRTRDDAGANLVAVFSSGLFEIALECSVRQFIDVQYRTQVGGVNFNTLGGHGPGPVSNRRARIFSPGHERTYVAAVPTNFPSFQIRYSRGGPPCRRRQTRRDNGAGNERQKSLRNHYLLLS